MAGDASKSPADANVAQVQAQLVASLRETTNTQSRPVGPAELSYTLSRKGGGMSDPGSILPLVCTAGHTITDDEVVLACAVLRLRYPLLASNMSFIGKPHVVVNTPLTQAHALRMGKEQIEFHTFDDQDRAVTALRDRWLAFEPNDALDVRMRTCALWWGRDADPRAGKYILGVISTHAVTDNRRRLNVARSFLELLASPGQAQKELDAHFAGKATPVPIPRPTEQLKPELSDDETQAAEARAVFDELVSSLSSKPMSGIVADGSPSPPWIPRILRKVWSAEETTRILRACKAHGVTITHLVNVAGALSSLPEDGESVTDQTDDAVYFEYMQPIDITAKTPAQAAQAFNGPDMEAACRVELYPVVLRVPRADVLHVWEVARLFRERNAAFVHSPHFWRMLPMYLPFIKQSYVARLAGKPALPFMSSLGDLKTVLPSRYSVKAAGSEPEAGGYPGAEIRVSDNWTTGRIDPFSLVHHLFTFDGRLYLQFRYNVNRTSDALIEPWFDRLVDIVSQSAYANS
ncbi:hypothetical protein C8Q72DRAFT_561734 [Fomitopsis betulina]|nr:hypothetical protein C8Q72DRAFT_561734 [Fomitopsis betulina]